MTTCGPPVVFTHASRSRLPATRASAVYRQCSPAAPAWERVGQRCCKIELGLRRRPYHPARLPASLHGTTFTALVPRGASWLATSLPLS
jgi:hypothetical protein